MKELVDRKGVGRAGGIGWLVVVLVLLGAGAVRAQEFTDAISRKVSVLNGAGEFGDAVSRTIAVGNGTQEFVDANGRLFSVTTTLYGDAIGRQVAVWSEPPGMVEGFGDANDRLLTVHVNPSRPGSIVAWGLNVDGQCDVPAPNEDFVAVAGGFVFSLGLKSDSTVVAWGDNEHGQCNVPEPNSGFVAIAAGDSHCLGLKSDGTIVGWGGLHVRSGRRPPVEWRLHRGRGGFESQPGPEVRWDDRGVGLQR